MQWRRTASKARTARRQVYSDPVPVRRRTPVPEPPAREPHQKARYFPRAQLLTAWPPLRLPRGPPQQPPRPIGARVSSARPAVRGAPRVRGCQYRCSGCVGPRRARLSARRAGFPLRPVQWGRARGGAKGRREERRKRGEARISPGFGVKELGVCLPKSGVTCGAPTPAQLLLSRPAGGDSCSLHFIPCAFQSEAALER